MWLFCSEDGWTTVKHLKNGNEGFAPTNYLTKENGRVESEEWVVVDTPVSEHGDVTAILPCLDGGLRWPVLMPPSSWCFLEIRTELSWFAKAKVCLQVSSNFKMLISNCFCHEQQMVAGSLSQSDSPTQSVRQPKESDTTKFNSVKTKSRIQFQKTNSNLWKNWLNITKVRLRLLFFH